MLKFIKGRRYRNNETWYVESRTSKSLTLKTEKETVTCPVSKDKITEYCFPKDGTVLKAGSIVGRPKHYTDEENKEIRIKASRAFNEKTYKTISFNVPPEVAQRLKDAAEKLDTSQRQLVMAAINEYLIHKKI